MQSWIRVVSRQARRFRVKSNNRQWLVLDAGWSDNHRSRNLAAVVSMAGLPVPASKLGALTVAGVLKLRSNLYMAWLLDAAGLLFDGIEQNRREEGAQRGSGSAGVHGLMTASQQRAREQPRTNARMGIAEEAGSSQVRGVGARRTNCSW